MDFSPTEVVELANNLLLHTGIPRRVKTARQCNSTLFLQLYETLTGSRVPGLVLHAPTSESVKCQAVVDALSNQLSPHVSLNHIRGELLARPDLMAVKHLLDVFSVLFHLPRAGIGGEESGSELEDSNVISREGFSVISEVIKEELGTSHSYSTDSTVELLRPVPRGRVPDVIHERGRVPGVTREKGTVTHERGRVAREPLREDSGSTTLPSSSLHTTNSSGREKDPSLTITSLDDTTDIGETPQPRHEHAAMPPSRTITSQTVERDKQPSILIPSGTSTSHPRLPQTPLHRQRLLTSPLHHSTPHTSTRSRVYERHPSPPPSPSGQLRSQADQPTVLPLLHPPSTNPPRQETDRQREITRGVDSATEEMRRLRPEVEREGQSPQLVSSGVQTDATLLTSHSEDSGTDEEHSLPLAGNPEGVETADDHPLSSGPVSSPVRPHSQPSKTKVHFSSSTTFREHQGTTGGRRDGVPQRLDLDSRIAQTRANVLASLYRNYLRELNVSAKPQTGAKLRTPKAASSKQKKRSKHKADTRAPTSRKDASSSSGEEEESGGDTHTRIGDGDDILPVVEKEFPFIHVSPATMRRLWHKQIQQITALTKPQLQKPTAVKKVAEMERRHTALLHVIRKELDHTRRTQRQAEAQHERRAVRAALRTRRQAAARARKYYNEYELRMKAKLQKRRTREEQIFRRAFEDGLELQRERIRELRRFAKEKQQAHARQHQEQLESLENYYRDQFVMLTETMTRERGEITVREKAQNQLVRRMRRDVRERLESEIKQLQECLDREEDIAHFRELDAQGLRHKLNNLTFTTSVK